MDYAKLEKEIKELHQKKLSLDDSIKNLSDEKIKYMKDVPRYEEEAKAKQKEAEKARARTLEIIRDIAAKDQVLKAIKDEIENAKKILISTKEQNIVESHKLSAIKEKLADKDHDLSKRELEVRNRERLAQSREEEHKRNIEKLDKEIADLDKKRSALMAENLKLCRERDEHKSNVDIHASRESVFQENRKAFLNDQEVLKGKLQKADEIIKKNEEIKAGLLVQQHKLDEEIGKCMKKQAALDRNIADLANQEKLLKVKELRVRKLVHDHGLDKEFKELEESLK